jgi:membrane-bound serine protease (ClpP class)
MPQLPWSALSSAYCRFVGWALAAVWLAALPVWGAADDRPQEGPPGVEEPAHYARGVLIRIEGEVTPMLEQYLFRKLDVARADHADLVIVEIDSPGGFLVESLEIAEKLRDMHGVHTVAYIPREALSGAAIAALGCDEIVMHPRALLGDAGPIFQDEDGLFRHAPEKIRSHLAQKLRDLATAKGRPPALAEAMVDMQRRVYEVVNTKSGATRFMNDAEIKADDHPDEWKKVKPVLESGDGHFLEVNGTRAVELGLASTTVADRTELAHRYHLDGLRVIEPSLVDTAVYILNMQFVTGLLFVVGLIALYVEVSAPGVGLGGLVAGLCFALFFWSRFLGGTADWLEVVLFVAGGVFIGVELFVFPGFGVAGLTGLLLLFASLVLASQRFIVPSNTAQLQTLSNTLLVVVLSGGAFAVSAVILSKYLGSIPMLGHLTLKPPESSAASADMDQSAEAEAVRVGVLGVADSPLRPAGKARFGDVRVDVVTDGAFITRGSAVQVIEVSRNRVVVSEAPPIS